MPARRAFTLLETMIVLILVALATSVLVQYLERVPGEALVTRARRDLADLRKEVLGRALEVPEYHFPDLASGLRGRPVPEDPWGEPYRMLHADPSCLPALDPAVPPSPCRGRGLTEHLLVSGGPDRKVGGDGTEDDLFVVLKLGKPAAGVPVAVPSSEPAVLPVLATRSRTDALYLGMPGVERDMGGVRPAPEPEPDPESDPEASLEPEP